MDGGAIFCCDGKREFLKFETAQGVGCREHERAAEALPLVARQDADLRGVADAGRDFAGEDGADKIVAARIVEDEGSARNELAAAGEQNNIFEKAKSAGLAAVLIVDVAVDVVGVGEKD